MPEGQLNFKFQIESEMSFSAVDMHEHYWSPEDQFETVTETSSANLSDRSDRRDRKRPEGFHHLGASKARTNMPASRADGDTMTRPELGAAARAVLRTGRNP